MVKLAINVRNASHLRRASLRDSPGCLPAPGPLKLLIGIGSVFP